MQLAIVEFPGSYGATEMKLALSSFFDVSIECVHYTADAIPKCDLLIAPGGSSFSDVFRPGALAKATRMGHRIRQFAQQGGRVLGIGNGFQLLTELELLPGGLFLNNEPGMLLDDAYIVAQPRDIGLTKFVQAKEIYKLPIAGNYARYVISKRQLEEAESYDGVVFAYCNEEGEIDSSALYNGCTKNIAGITNKEGNVLGMMAHPERLSDPIQGSLDGKSLLAGLLYALELP